MKVLIYSSKEIYDTSSYEGRSEADLIAYKNVDRSTYTIVKLKDSLFPTSEYILDPRDYSSYDPDKRNQSSLCRLQVFIERVERSQFRKELELLGE